mmetsp:Transcript_41666/g.100353  ORF Transcript_41666/g.100353 Transcript_41666/m.100353 type:complete len:137 (-) Transcript_41666:821-1231(-)
MTYSPAFTADNNVDGKFEAENPCIKIEIHNLDLKESNAGYYHPTKDCFDARVLASLPPIDDDYESPSPPYSAPPCQPQWTKSPCYRHTTGTWNQNLYSLPLSCVILPSYHSFVLRHDSSRQYPESNHEASHCQGLA